MTFANPALLALLVLVPATVLACWLWDRHRRRELLAQLGDRALIDQLTASASPGRRGFKMMLVAAAGCALALALARPQVEGSKEVEIRGLDVVIALDVSTSMLVSDVAITPAMAGRKLAPTRLALARETIAGLVAALPGDRIGPVVFAAAAAHFPLTEDHEVALQFFSDLGPADLPRGSRVAEALRVSRCLLRRDLFDDLGCAKIIGQRGDGGRPLSGERELQPSRASREAAGEVVEHEERGRAVVVFSDGGDDLADAVREVQTAKELGIAVFFIGVGSADGGPVYDIDDQARRIAPKLDAQGRPVISRRSDAELRALAASAGDATRYLIADPQANPIAITTALDQVSRGLATKKSKQRLDVFQPFVFVAMMLLLLDAAIATRRRRSPPRVGAISPRPKSG